MRTSPVYLAIPQPCHENWDLMTPTERGRFCQACRKEVRDFSEMPAADILRVLQLAPEGSVCGRIPVDALQESRRLAEAAARRPHWPWVSHLRQVVAAVGLPLLAYSPGPARATAAAEVAQAHPPRVRTRPLTVQLRIYDPATGQGLGFAAVQLWQADSLLRTTQAEADGTLQLTLPAADTLRVRVQVPGYRTTEETLRPAGVSGPVAIPMQAGPEQLAVVDKAVEAPQTQRQVLGGAISSIEVYHPTPVQRIVQAPKRLFWWLRQRSRR
ncbi:carboxypeptidase-like regulatory domain-containing protein [Hymenobacter endophyticus]|uniref:Carboxypeptidase-like regulatory domain-containing protein n=1 Tax=Hymenobacter endophyticus TaxID=3076335 RepID=A0ABU3TJK0_9BACT|nr:carboxypeptidase-like regulatory domain-containing protein [Hymenobacter endophyticus]MDU0371400.1 carboxypeptidase-like regulatory domain-containing protein [Hymenobacter endophyticus]